MSQPAVITQQNVDAALRGDTALRALFPSGTVRLYDLPPTNAPVPYLVIGEDDFTDLSGEDVSISGVAATVHIWSRTDPPGKVEAKRIGQRVEAILVGLATDEGAIRTAWLIAARYLADTDAVTCHGIIRVGMSRETA